jgi:hypothetical protein
LLKSQGFLYEETMEVNKFFFQELDEIINPPSQEDVIKNQEIDVQEKSVVFDSSSWAGRVKQNLIAPSLQEVQKPPNSTKSK